MPDIAFGTKTVIYIKWEIYAPSSASRCSLVVPSSDLTDGRLSGSASPLVGAGAAEEEPPSIPAQKPSPAKSTRPATETAIAMVLTFLEDDPESEDAVGGTVGDGVGVGVGGGVGAGTGVGVGAGGVGGGATRMRMRMLRDGAGHGEATARGDGHGGVHGGVHGENDGAPSARRRCVTWHAARPMTHIISMPIWHRPRRDAHERARGAVDGVRSRCGECAVWRSACG